MFTTQQSECSKPMPLPVLPEAPFPLYVYRRDLKALTPGWCATDGPGRFHFAGVEKSTSELDSNITYQWAIRGRLAVNSCPTSSLQRSLEGVQKAARVFSLAPTWNDVLAKVRGAWITLQSRRRANPLRGSGKTGWGSWLRLLISSTRINRLVSREEGLLQNAGHRDIRESRLSQRDK